MKRIIKFTAASKMMRELLKSGYKVERGAANVSSELSGNVMKIRRGAPLSEFWHESGHALDMHGTADGLKRATAYAEAQAAQKATGAAPNLAYRQQTRDLERRANRTAEQAMTDRGARPEYVQQYRNEVAPHLNDYRKSNSVAAPSGNPANPPGNPGNPGSPIGINTSASPAQQAQPAIPREPIKRSFGGAGLAIGGAGLLAAGGFAAASQKRPKDEEQGFSSKAKLIQFMKNPLHREGIKPGTHRLGGVGVERKVRIRDIVSSQALVDEKKVRKLARFTKNMPGKATVSWNGKNWIAKDGNHRLNAMLKQGKRKATVMVQKLSSQQPVIQFGMFIRNGRVYRDALISPHSILPTDAASFAELGHKRKKAMDYAARWTKGSTPPKISTGGIDADTGKIYATEGHHRVMAAKHLDKMVPAQISYRLSKKSEALSEEMKAARKLLGFSSPSPLIQFSGKWKRAGQIFHRHDNQMMIEQAPGAYARLTGTGTYGKIRGSKGYNIDELTVPAELQGNGVASSIMKKITDHADRRKKTISLKPVAGIGREAPGLSQPELEAFYRRRGFAPTERDERVWSRNPSQLSAKQEPIQFTTISATKNLLRDLRAQGVGLTRKSGIAAYEDAKRLIHVPKGGNSNAGPRSLLWHEAGHAEAHSAGMMDDFLKAKKDPAIRSAQMLASATGRKSPALSALRSETRHQERLANDFAQRRMVGEGVPQENIATYRSEMAPGLNTYRAGHREVSIGKPGANKIISSMKEPFSIPRRSYGFTSRLKPIQFMHNTDQPQPIGIRKRKLIKPRNPIQQLSALLDNLIELAPGISKKYAAGTQWDQDVETIDERGKLRAKPSLAKEYHSAVIKQAEPKIRGAKINRRVEPFIGEIGHKSFNPASVKEYEDDVLYKQKNVPYPGKPGKTYTRREIDDAEAPGGRRGVKASDLRNTEGYRALKARQISQQDAPRIRQGYSEADLIARDVKESDRPALRRGIDADPSPAGKYEVLKAHAGMRRKLVAGDVKPEIKNIRSAIAEDTDINRRLVHAIRKERGESGEGGFFREPAKGIIPMNPKSAEYAMKGQRDLLAAARGNFDTIMEGETARRKAQAGALHENVRKRANEALVAREHGPDWQTKLTGRKREQAIQAHAKKASDFASSITAQLPVRQDELADLLKAKPEGMERARQQYHSLLNPDSRTHRKVQNRIIRSGKVFDGTPAFEPPAPKVIAKKGYPTLKKIGIAGAVLGAGALGYHMLKKRREQEPQPQLMSSRARLIQFAKIPKKFPVKLPANADSALTNLAHKLLNKAEGTAVKNEAKFAGGKMPGPEAPASQWAQVEAAQDISPEATELVDAARKRVRKAIAKPGGLKKLQPHDVVGDKMSEELSPMSKGIIKNEKKKLWSGATPALPLRGSRAALAQGRIESTLVERGIGPFTDINEVAKALNKTPEQAQRIIAVQRPIVARTIRADRAAKRGYTLKHGQDPDVVIARIKSEMLKAQGDKRAAEKAAAQGIAVAREQAKAEVGAIRKSSESATQEALGKQSATHAEQTKKARSAAWRNTAIGTGAGFLGGVAIAGNASSQSYEPKRKLLMASRSPVVRFSSDAPIKSRKIRKSTFGHDVAVGAIEGGIVGPFTQPVFSRLGGEKPVSIVPGGIRSKKGWKKFGKNALIGAGFGALTTSATGLGVNVMSPFKFSSKRKLIEFSKSSERAQVSRDRYEQQNYDKDELRAGANYKRSALTGGTLAMLLRGSKTRLGTFMAGAGGGLAAQAATRLVTSASKDKFGDRSHLGKKIDKLPWQVPALIAGGIIGKRAYKAGALKLSSKGKLIQFISDDEEKRIGESLQGERDWRKAKGQVARATQGIKRGTRLTQDLIRAAKGQKNLDSRGRERKREWDKPWVRNAITGTIAVGTLAGFHRVIKSTGPGSQLGRMKEMYHRGDFHEAARNKIPGFKKVHDWVRGFKGNATAEAGAAAENSGVLGKMLDKVQKAAGRTGQEAKTIRNIDGSTTVLPAGTTARIAHDKRTMPTAEKEIAQTADEITRKQAARLREIQGGTIIKNSAKGKVIQFQKFQYDGELYDERRDGDLVKLKKIRRRNRDETPTLDTKRWHESLWTPAKIGGGVVAGALGARLLGPRMNAASAASSSVKRIAKTTDLREELKRVVNQHSLDPIVTLNATLDRAIEFGTRTLAGGQIVKWGKHLPSKLPLGTHGESRRGIYQIFDPTKRASVTIQRSRGPMPHEGEAKTKVEKLFNPQANGGKGGTVEINTPQASEKWWKGKNAYLANTNMQPAIRKTPEGAIAAGSLMVGSRAPGATQRTGGLLPHLDHRGVTARTTAGAYQRTSVKSKMEGTHDLVKQYQKRGFKIDARGTYPNEWNVGMIRKPGAKPIEPIEAQKYDTYMRSIRSRALSGAAKGISRHLKELIPGAGTMTGVAALTGTAAVANSDSEHSDLAKKTLVPLAIAGGGLAAHKLYKTGKYIAGHAKEITDHALTAAAHGRIGIGRRLAETRSRGSKWLGGRMLRGYA